MTLRMLVSVRDVDEAMAAADAGADFIDVKDPAAGALGGLAPARIALIASTLRARRGPLAISATIGDMPGGRVDEILERVARVAACGVDYVKVGVAPGDSAADAAASAVLLHALARCGASVVPVLIADRGIDEALVRAALHEGSSPSTPAFPALMLDTEDKRGGSLLQRIPHAALVSFIASVRAAGRLAGLAGALRGDDIEALNALAPDFAGFRSAVCAGSRAGRLDPARVRDLRGRLAAGSRGRHLADIAR